MELQLVVNKQKLCAQIPRAGPLEKQSADNQPLFPGSKLLLQTLDLYRICRLTIFAVCLRAELSLIVGIAMYSIYYYQTNSSEVAKRRSFQQKKNLVEDLSGECDKKTSCKRSYL